MSACWHCDMHIIKTNGKPCNVHLIMCTLWQVGMLACRLSFTYDFVWHIGALAHRHCKNSCAGMLTCHTPNAFFTMTKNIVL